MPVLVSERCGEPWRRRLYLPAYPVGEAVRYAGVSPRTVAAWHQEDARGALSLTTRGRREELSYLQLIEVAVVAAFRKAGISLRRIREAREYVSKELKTEFPFAAYRFKTNGKRLLIDYRQVEGREGQRQAAGGQYSMPASLGSHYRCPPTGIRLLPTVLAAAKAIYGQQFNPLITLKALCFFDDGDLRTLPDEMRRRLARAAAAVDPVRLPRLARQPDHETLPGGQS